MLNIFQLKNNHLLRIDDTYNISSIRKAIWVDIIKPINHDQYNHIRSMLDQNIINFFEAKDTQRINRFYRNEYGLYISSFFFSHNDKNQIDNSTILFVIHNECLYTLRKEKFPVFCIYQKILHNHLLNSGNVYELLLNLFETKINDITDKIEYIYNTLTKLSIMVTNKLKIEEYNSVLTNLAVLENMVWKVHTNLLDTERVIKFLIRKGKLPLEQLQYANEILNDITLLIPHNECIFQKISLLIQSTIGFITIEQNRIIKIFSVIFLPPTLIASSYGMNFEFMPELQWSFGYPGAIILMILTGLAPYLYLKYKNWL